MQAEQYRVPYPLAFDATRQVLESLRMSIRFADAAIGVVDASVALSGFSWGEKVRVSLLAMGDEWTRVEATSALRFGLADWGKNRKNVVSIQRALAVVFAPYYPGESRFRLSGAVPVAIDTGAERPVGEVGS